MALLANQIQNVAPVNASYSGATKALSLVARNAGTPYTASLQIVGETVTPTSVTPNTASGVQITSYTFSRSLVAGETLHATIDGSGVTQAFTTNTATTLTNLAASIDALAGVSAAVVGSDIVVTADVAGVGFTASPLTIDMSVANSLITPNVPAQMQI